MDDKKDEQAGDAASVGRPRKYASAAERQKAYRERLKAEGKRVVSRVMLDVRDTSAPLVSDVLDLSPVKGAKGV